MEAVIFDMDGVIVDSEAHWQQIGYQFLNQVIPHWSEDLQSSIIGMSANDVHQLLVTEHGLQLSRQEYFEYYRELAHSVYGERVQMLPGCQALLQLLQGENYTIGLASASPHCWINIVLERFGLRPYFRQSFSAEDVGGRGKPDPAIYLHAATVLGVNPERCVAIEDSARGVTSAKAAGMTVVGLSNGLNRPEDVAGADHIAEGFAELSPEVLRSLTN